MTPVWVFDIDGTLADITHLLPYIEANDYDSFYDRVAEAKPIAHVVALARKLMLDGGYVIFATGRSSVCTSNTMAWLKEHLGVRGPLYMRTQDDHRPDAVVKMELLDRMRKHGFEPIMIFEDRTRVVNAWRAAGVPCAQVAPGDY